MILEYKGIQIFYTDQGHGPEVVLLHGFLETSAMWQDIAPELEISNRTITIDLLGHGQTGCLGYIHTMEMMAEAVAFVLGQLKVQSAVFIGHSMGGYVALALAESFPELIRLMCLVNSTPFADSAEKQQNRDRAINLVKRNPTNFINMSIGNLFCPKNRKVMAEEIHQVKEQALKLSVQGIIAALEGMKIRKDRSNLLQNMLERNIVILGREDPALEYVSLATRLNALSIAMMAFEGGHMLYIENKYELTYFLKRFIEN